MFHLFTEKAIKTIMLAQQESVRFGHFRVAPEQILLGLMGAGESISLNALKSMGVTLEMLRSGVTKIVPNGSNPAVIEIPFTDSAKRALELARDEAQKLGHDYIGTEHLLLGLLRAKDSVVEAAMANLDADTTRLQRHVLARIAETGSPPAASDTKET